MAQTCTPPLAAATSIDPDRFHRVGFHGPFAVVDEVEMARLRPDLESLLTTPADACPSSSPLMARHMDNATMRDLASRETVQAPLRSLLGPDLLMWNSYLWNKEPGGSEIPWHQDIHYWPIEPQLTISLWLAVDATDEENSCPHIIPGSHRRSLPHRRAEGRTVRLGEEADPAHFDASQAIPMSLRAGEGFLFTERLLHSSTANRSSRRRFGISLRYSPTLVQIFHDEAPLFPGHAALLVGGTDRFGWNRYC